MPLGAPPAGAGSLAGLPRRALGGRRLFRVWRHTLADGGTRTSPWWFAAIDPGRPEAGGRFDLTAPMGTCYLATRAVAALLEALQTRLTLLPRPELAVRRLAELKAPGDAPDAAMLTARSVAGRFGITAELWAGRERKITQAWAAALRRDGWWAVYGGISHDPSGRLRSVALFDAAGAHPPTHGAPWACNLRRIDRDRDLEDALARYGVTVREPGQLPWARPPNGATK